MEMKDLEQQQEVHKLKVERYQDLTGTEMNDIEVKQKLNRLLKVLEKELCPIEF